MSGTWHRLDLADISALQTVDGVLPEVSDDAPRATMVRNASGVVLATLDHGQLIDTTKVDVALAMLHGPYGEDGTIQGYFEMLGLPYVGSGVAASAVGMDKHLMKVGLAAAGIPIGPYEVVLPGLWARDPAGECDRINAKLTYPLFVKPARGGSSVGIVRVTEPAKLADAIAEAANYDPKVVVEQGFVGAREVECAVLGPAAGQAHPRTSSPGEIVVHTGGGFYDFQAKYLPTEGQVDLNVPADLPTTTASAVKAVAAAAFEALGCEGLSRVDTFVDPDGEVFVNEVNTLPGFTKLSMFPSLWQASGLSYPDLIADLIEQALARPNTVVR